MLLLFTSAYGIWALRPDVVAHYPAECVLVIAAGPLENVASILRYGRPSSFHTYHSKIAGYLLGIFVGVLFVFGLHPWLLHAAVAASVLGNLEELALLAGLRGLEDVHAEIVNTTAPGDAMRLARESAAFDGVIAIVGSLLAFATG